MDYSCQVFNHLGKIKKGNNKKKMMRDQYIHIKNGCMNLLDGTKYKKKASRGFAIIQKVTGKQSVAMRMHRLVGFYAQN